MDVNNEVPAVDIVANNKWYTYITVEPVMFFYMFAFMTTSVVEQSFFIHKACLVNHGLSPEICNHLNETINADYNNKVQATVSTFHQWNGISGQVFPIILALFIGAWSDKRGRKAIMLSGLFGKFLYSFMVIVISSQETWPLWYVIYFATIPSAMTGADVAIFAACFSYLSDVTTTKDRTFRVGILDICYLSTIPTGVALGSFLFNKVFDKSYEILFGINASMLALAILIAYFNLHWQTSIKQKSMAEAGVKNFFSDFFNLKHALDSLKCIGKKRPGHRRVYLIMLMFSIAFYAFQRDEKPMLYLYTVKVFGWDTIKFSNFKTFQSVAFVIMMLIGIPLMSKVFKWKDTVILMIGTMSHTLGRIFFASAQVPWLFYVGALVASLGPCVAPVIRSLTSKAIQTDERGKVFAVLSVCDNAVVLFSASLYSQLYNATIETSHPNSIFYLTMATQMTVFILSLCIHISLKGQPMEQQKSSSLNTALAEEENTVNTET